MNPNQVAKFVNEIHQVHGLGEELLNKNEFVFLTKYFLVEEKLNSLAVGQILGKLYLLVFTDQRFFFVEKNELNLFQFQRIGLEAIVNLQLENQFDETNLIMTLVDQRVLKISGMSEKKAIHFGKNLIEAHRLWNDRLLEI